VGTPNRLKPDFNTKALPDIPDIRHDDEPIKAGRDNKEMFKNFLLSIIMRSLDVRISFLNNPIYL
jgi:hypothetical protein